MIRTRRLRATRPVVAARSATGWTLAVALAVITLLFCGALLTAPVAAKAPALAMVASDTPMLVTPDEHAPVIRMLTRGMQVELTGSASAGHLQIIVNDEYGWASAQALAISNQIGIPLATAVAETPILAAPLPDAATLGVVPPGGAVILLGANVGIYTSGSYEGVGGWLLESNLNLPYDNDGNGS